MDIAVGAEDGGQLWDVQQAAHFLRLKPFTVRAWVRQRRMPAIKRGRMIRFDPQQIKKWLEGFKG